jgi:O-antigen/teichoic acid export membrane protein
LLNSIFLWIFNKWRPSIEFSIRSFKELFRFGYKLLLSGLIDTIYKNIYYLVIGKFYTKEQLGQYTRAEQFKIIFSNNLTSVVQRVSYPVLCEIQDERERLVSSYKRVIRSTMLVAFACMLGLAAIAKPLIVVLIGEKWLLSAEYLQIICFSGMLYPLHAINLNMLQVKGRSDLFLKLEIIKKIIATIPLILGIIYGIKIMLVVGFCNSVISYLLNSYYSGKLLNYSTIMQITDILPAFLISFVVAIIMWSITLVNCSYWILLLLQLIAGFIMTVVIYEKLKSPEYIEIKHIVLSVIKKLRR